MTKHLKLLLSNVYAKHLFLNRIASDPASEASNIFDTI